MLHDIKNIKTAKTTLILVKTDVVRCIPTSVLKKPMLNCVFWRNFYIGSEKIDVKSVFTISVFDRTDAECADHIGFTRNQCRKCLYNIGFLKKPML